LLRGLIFIVLRQIDQVFQRDLAGSGQFCWLLPTSIALACCQLGIGGPGGAQRDKENTRRYEAHEALFHDWFLLVIGQPGQSVRRQLFFPLNNN
jgi:hypothetical protein